MAAARRPLQATWPSPPCSPSQRALSASVLVCRLRYQRAPCGACAAHLLGCGSWVHPERACLCCFLPSPPFLALSNPRPRSTQFPPPPRVSVGEYLAAWPPLPAPLPRLFSLRALLQSPHRLSPQACAHREHVSGRRQSASLRSRPATREAVRQRGGTGSPLLRAAMP